MNKLIYHVGKLSQEDEFKLDFADGLSRPVEERIKLGFIVMKLPVIDDAPYRVFNTMSEYRSWADKNLPRWLGYHTQDD